MLYQLSYASGFFVTSTSGGSIRRHSILALPGAVTLRAGDGTRTRDIKLGRLALYQLSYSRVATNSGQLQSLKKIRPLNTDGGGRIRTFEGVSRQIYSLLLLATQEPHRILAADFGRADGENRTPNLLITNQLLCQLSYVSNKQRFFIASQVE